MAYVKELKGIAYVNQQLKNKGYLPAEQKDIEVNYLSMIQLRENELVEYANDKNTPMMIRILAKSILNEKFGFEYIDKILDRAIGKAKQQNSVELSGNVSVSNILKEIQGMK